MEINTQINIFDPVEVDGNYFVEHLEEQEEFYNIARTLPEPVLNILFGLNTPNIIKKVCETYQLQINQSANLSRLIRKILVTEIYLGGLVDQIKVSLNIDELKAKAIANDIVGQLFASALDEIKKMHIEKFGKRENPSEPPVVNLNNVLDLRKKDS